MILYILEYMYNYTFIKTYFKSFYKKYIIVLYYIIVLGKQTEKWCKLDENNKIIYKNNTLVD